DESMLFNAGEEPVIYDCGSNVGVSVIYFKKKFPKAKIIAFEPDPKVYDCLSQNLKINNIQDVKAVNKAVWIHNGELEFGSEGADGGSVFQKENKIKVSAVRLKELLEKENRIDCLKMDIEGAETEVLTDCKNVLSKIKYLFVEYHSWKNQEQQLDSLLNILSENGFRYYINSIGEKSSQPFIKSTGNPMDVQLDIHAVNTRL